MKLKIYAEETFTTTATRERIEIDTDNYPELEGMTEDEISDYIDEDEDGNDIIVIRYCRGDKKSLRKLTEKGRILMYDKYGYDFSDDKQDTLSTMRGYFGDK